MIELRVGLGTCGIAAGAEEVFRTLNEKVREKGLDVKVKRVGCLGFCFAEPLVELVEDKKSFFYKNMKVSKVDKLLDSLVRGEVIEDWLISPEEVEDFLFRQKRIALRNCGKIDPEDIGDYLAHQGYQGIERALSMEPEEVRKEVQASGLRGRGGAGFPTGRKWEFAAAVPSDKRFIICNADEGDPGAFMDRSVLEGDPHSVIEGMLIAGYAVGASEGVIYVRAEYPLAIKRLKIALKQAREKGFLGQNILGKSFDFEIFIMEGAGAFVCGEETALIASIEGKRGMPRPRPPYPAISGLFGKPTVINNVETLSNIPWILVNGAESFSSLGTEKSKGTKVFALAGKILRTGLVEVPMGTTLREVIFRIGGGLPSKRRYKAVQIGGPSGGCLPAELLDTPVDYESLTKSGAIVGSGGMIVLDDRTCMVDVARYFLNFTRHESCGKCVSCRVGLNEMYKILERISQGEGREEDLDTLAHLGKWIKDTALCALGGTAPNPVLTTLRYFRHEYEEHLEGVCSAGVCRSLITFSIREDLCSGCQACLRVCPTGAISGERKKPHIIDELACIKCGACREVCRYEAIITKPRAKEGVR